MSAKKSPLISWIKKLHPLHALAHILAGAGLYLVLTPRTVWVPMPWLIVVAALVALLPDLDSLARVPHRTATHSIAAAALVWWVAHTLGPKEIADAIAWGYISHILVDLLHGQGVGLAWPLPDHAQVAAASVGTIAALAMLAVWAGFSGDAPVYHLWRTPTPTPAPAPIAGWPACLPTAAAAKVQVVRVLDGDTLIARWPDGHTDRVRLLGVNAPEVSHPEYGKPGEPGGQEATTWLRQQLAQAHTIYIVAEQGRNRDRYGRLLAYVVADGQLLNEALLREGLARLYMEKGLSCEAALAEAAAAANLAMTGIYRVPTPTPTLTPTPTPTVGFDYQAAILLVHVERVHLRMTAIAATATAAPWKYNATWYTLQEETLLLDESEAWLRLQAHLAAHPPTPTLTPTPTPTPTPSPHGPWPSE